MVQGGSGSVIVAQFTVEAKLDLAQVIQAGVIVYHAREDLRQVVEVDPHSVFPDAHAICYQHPNLDSVGKRLEVGDGIRYNSEVRVKGKPQEELHTLLPGCGVGAESDRADAIMLRPSCSMEMVIHLTLCETGQSNQ